MGEITLIAEPASLNDQVIDTLVPTSRSLNRVLRWYIAA